ncbi:MAG: hypothetical protein ACXVFN_02745 [Solirubrobacteraceae bacterium]
MNVRVLLCEDYVALRELVRGACEDAGHVVVGEAAAAEEAAALALRTEPDVVVLDLSSCATPADTIRPLAEAAPGSAIVAYTGLSPAAVGAGALTRLAAHVSKTAPLAELVRAIERAAYATAAGTSR